MKQKSIFGALLIMLLCLTLVGCGDSDGRRHKDRSDDTEVEATNTPTSTPTEAAAEPTKAVTPAEPTATPTPDVPKPIAEYPIYNSRILFGKIRQQGWEEVKMDWGFSEDRAWVIVDDGTNRNPIAMIDKDGKILFKITSDEYKSLIGCAGNFYGIDIAAMKAGYAVISNINSENEGFLIVDKNGVITFNANDGDDTTRYHFLGQCEDKFLVCKEEQSFASSGARLLVIDANGAEITEVNTGDDKVNAKTYADCGEGIMFCYGNNAAINTSNWAYIKVHTDVNGLIVSDGYVATTSEYIRVEDFTSQESFEANKKKKNGFWAWEYNEGKYFNDGKYLDVDDNVCVVPNVPETVKIEDATAFSDGYAFLKMTGADGNAYVVAIDKNGEFLFDPIKGQDFPVELTKKTMKLGENNHGYVPIYFNELMSFDLVAFLKYDGTIFAVGDDLSELGDLVFAGRQDDDCLYRNGFFTSSYFGQCSFTTENGVVSDFYGQTIFFLSADGKKAIQKVGLYK